jgi:hypothetical protein
MQEHLLTFEQQWTDEASGRTLPMFVTDELHKYLDCGILGRGFAHLYCDSCGEHHVVAFSCKARAVCPSCLGRRMPEGAANLVDHVLPDVPIREFVLTLPFPLRFPLAFDGKLLGQVVRLFMPADVPKLRPARPPRHPNGTGMRGGRRTTSTDGKPFHPLTRFARRWVLDRQCCGSSGNSDQTCRRVPRHRSGRSTIWYRSSNAVVEASEPP